MIRLSPAFVLEVEPHVRTILLTVLCDISFVRENHSHVAVIVGNRELIL